MLTTALRSPIAAGVKVTKMVQLPPDGTDVPQVLVSAKSPLLAPVMPMKVMVKVELPALVNVEVRDYSVRPTAGRQNRDWTGRA